MSMKSLAVGLCMFILAAPWLHAIGVSFLVMETGLAPDNATSQYSVMWENSLLEVFFDSGYIVTNAPRMRLTDAAAPEGFPVEAERDHEDARDGGMDYFLIAIVDHPSHDVSLRLFSTRSREVVAEITHAGGPAWNSREEHENIRRSVRAMAALLR